MNERGCFVEAEVRLWVEEKTRVVVVKVIAV